MTVRPSVCPSVTWGHRVTG